MEVTEPTAPGRLERKSRGFATLLIGSHRQLRSEVSLLTWSDLPIRKIVEGKILAAAKATCIQSSVTTSVRIPAIRMRVEKLELSSVGFDALILFEVARLLRKFPVLNAVCDRGRIGEYQEINIGWALDGGQGLLVPGCKILRPTECARDCVDHGTPT